MRIVSARDFPKMSESNSTSKSLKDLLQSCSASKEDNGLRNRLSKAIKILIDDMIERDRIMKEIFNIK